ncbi:MAG: class I SAM-dependent methyltransferase [Thermoanaerobaculia bacterium]
MSIPLPPESYRRLVCGEDWEKFEEHGRGLFEMLREFGFLDPGARLLDIGCGCGRLPRFLVDLPLGGYDGFDRHPGMIDWCQEAFTPLADRFRFHCFDLASAYEEIDGVGGSQTVEQFAFPFPDGEFDSIVASSVFTHLDVDDVRAYLERIHGWLAPAGRAYVSVFHLDGESSRDGLGFFLPPARFSELLAEAGLRGENPFGTRFGPQHNWYILSKL